MVPFRAGLEGSEWVCGWGNDQRVVLSGEEGSLGSASGGESVEPFRCVVSVYSRLLSSLSISEPQRSCDMIAMLIDDHA